MFLLHGESSYYDVLERVLYNGLISGISLSGDHFFYPNPLESDGGYERSEWFGCACCPSNVCRFIPSVPGYMYATNSKRLYVNLFIGSKADIDFNGSKVGIVQKTAYPWEGKVEMIITPSGNRPMELAVRIPGWAQNKPVPGKLYAFGSTDTSGINLMVNGEPVDFRMDKGYALIDRNWKKGDRVNLELPMPVRNVVADVRVLADQGRVALQRGPLVYCAEWTDNKDGKVLNLEMDTNANLQTEFRPDLLSGVTVIKGKDGFLAIPYYSWANRGAGEMAVWFKINRRSI
jgi:DUF1680 family protein